MVDCSIGTGTKDDSTTGFSEDGVGDEIGSKYFEGLKKMIYQ